jgi:hypothetical protein
MIGVPADSTKITTLRTKVIQTLDYVCVCPTDSMAINAWRTLCGHGYAMVSYLVFKEPDRLAALKESREYIDWDKRIKDIFDSFPKLQTHANTTTEVESAGESTICRAYFDGFDMRCLDKDLPLILEALAEDKHSRFCTNLMKFWGLCESVAMAAGLLTLDDEIEIPVSPNREYREQDLMSGIASKIGGRRG